MQILKGLYKTCLLPWSLIFSLQAVILQLDGRKLWCVGRKVSSFQKDLKSAQNVFSPADLKRKPYPQHKAFSVPNRLPHKDSFSESRTHRRSSRSGRR